MPTVLFVAFYPKSEVTVVMALNAMIFASLLVVSVLGFDTSLLSFPTNSMVRKSRIPDLSHGFPVPRALALTSRKECEAQCDEKESHTCRLIDIDNWHCLQVDIQPCVYFRANHTACKNCKFYCAQDKSQEHKCEFTECRGREMKVCVLVWWKGAVSKHISCEKLTEHHKKEVSALSSSVALPVSQKKQIANLRRKVTDLKRWIDKHSKSSKKEKADNLLNIKLAETELLDGLKKELKVLTLWQTHNPNIPTANFRVYGTKILNAENEIKAIKSSMTTSEIKEPKAKDSLVVSMNDNTPRKTVRLSQRKMRVVRGNAPESSHPKINLQTMSEKLLQSKSILESRTIMSLYKKTAVLNRNMQTLTKQFLRFKNRQIPKIDVISCKAKARKVGGVLLVVMNKVTGILKAWENTHPQAPKAERQTCFKEIVRMEALRKNVQHDLAIINGPSGRKKKTKLQPQPKVSQDKSTVSASVLTSAAVATLVKRRVVLKTYLNTLRGWRVKNRNAHQNQIEANIHRQKRTYRELRAIIKKELAVLSTWYRNNPKASKYDQAGYLKEKKRIATELKRTQAEYVAFVKASKTKDVQVKTTAILTARYNRCKGGCMSGTVCLRAFRMVAKHARANYQCKLKSATGVCGTTHFCGSGFFCKKGIKNQARCVRNEYVRANQRCRRSCKSGELCLFTRQMMGKRIKGDFQCKVKSDSRVCGMRYFCGSGFLCKTSQGGRAKCARIQLPTQSTQKCTPRCNRQKECLHTVQIIDKRARVRYQCQSKGSRNICGSRYYCGLGFKCQNELGKRGRCVQSTSSSLNRSIQGSQKCKPGCQDGKVCLLSRQMIGKRIRGSYQCKANSAQGVCGGKFFCGTGFSCKKGPGPRARCFNRKSTMQTRWKCGVGCASGKVCLRSFNMIGKVFKIKYHCESKSSRGVCGDQNFCGKGFKCRKKGSPSEFRCVSSNASVQGTQGCAKVCKVGEICLQARYMIGRKTKSSYRCHLKNVMEICGGRYFCGQGYICQKSGGGSGTCRRLQTSGQYGSFKCRPGCNKGNTCLRTFQMKRSSRRASYQCKARTARGVCGEQYFCGSGFACKDGSNGKYMCSRKITFAQTYPIQQQYGSKSPKQEWESCFADCAGINQKCVRIFNWNERKGKCVVNLACKGKKTSTCGSISICESGYKCQSNRCIRQVSDVESQSASEWKACSLGCQNIGQKCVRIFNWDGKQKKCAIELTCKSKYAVTCGKTSLCKKGYSCKSKRCRRESGSSGSSESEKAGEWGKCAQGCKSIGQKCVRIYNWDSRQQKCAIKLACEMKDVPTCGRMSLCKRGYVCKTNRCQRIGQQAGGNYEDEKVSEWKKCSSGCKSIGKKCVCTFTWDAIDNKQVIQMTCQSKTKATCGKTSLCQSGYACRSNRCRRIVQRKPFSAWRACIRRCKTNGRKCVRTFRWIAKSNGGRKRIRHTCVSSSRKTCGRYSLCRQGYHCGGTASEKCLRLTSSTTQISKAPVGGSRFKQCQAACFGRGKKCVRYFRNRTGKADERMGCVQLITNTNCGRYLDCREGYSCSERGGAKVCKKGFGSKEGAANNVIASSQSYGSSNGNMKTCTCVRASRCPGCSTNSTSADYFDTTCKEIERYACTGDLGGDGYSLSNLLKGPDAVKVDRCIVDPALIVKTFYLLDGAVSPIPNSIASYTCLRKEIRTIIKVGVDSSYDSAKTPSVGAGSNNPPSSVTAQSLGPQINIQSSTDETCFCEEIVSSRPGTCYTYNDESKTTCTSQTCGNSWKCSANQTPGGGTYNQCRTKTTVKVTKPSATVSGACTDEYSIKKNVFFYERVVIA